MGTDTTNRRSPRWGRRLGAYLASAILMLGLALGLAPATGAQTLAAHSAAAFSSARQRVLRAYRHDRLLHMYRLGRHASPKAHAAVVGGVQRSIEELPWQVAVFGEFEFEGELWLTLCGGSIVDMSHVVTAAHCTYNPFTGQQLPADDFIVLAGASRISEEEILNGATVQVRLVGDVRRHPDFDYAAGPGTPDDVAVLNLERELVPSAAVSTIALPSSPADPGEGTAATFSGFGAENSAASELNGNLYSLTTTLVPALRCGREAQAAFLCASTPAGSVCSGDSGGGLVESPGGTPTLIGVVDIVETKNGVSCPSGTLNGFVNVTAPEVREFIEGSEDPPLAPRGGGVSMRGVFTVGHEVTCETGNWSGEPTFTYAFVDSANERVLQQGASPHLMLSEADTGLAISCHLEATNAGGTARVRTEASAPVQAAPSTPPPPGGGSGNDNGGTNNGGSGNNGGSSGNNSATSSNPAGNAGSSTGNSGSPGETAHGGVLGYHSSHISAADIAALLRREIVPAGGTARAAKILAAARYTIEFRALEAGVAVVNWYALPSGTAAHAAGKRKPVLIATGRRTFSGASKGKLVVELTTAGKRLLEDSGSLRCTAEGVFTPHGEGPVVAVRAFALNG